MNSQSLNLRKEKSNKLAVPTSFEKEQSIGYLYIDMDHIIYLESDSNYTNIHTEERKITASKVLAFFEKELTKKFFFRIHASYIINLKKLFKYKKGTESIVTLTTGHQFNVSRSKKKAFENLETEKLPVLFNDEYTYIELDSILYIENRSDQVCIYLSDNKPMISTKNISFFESKLSNEPFFRIHNKYIVNLTKIIKYYKGKDTYVTLNTGISLTVSDGKKNEFLQLFKY